MGHRPAPVQISYIGFPVSTGASYIDYYLADNVALPAEHRQDILNLHFLFLFYFVILLLLETNLWKNWLLSLLPVLLTITLN